MYQEKIINAVTGEETFREYTAEEIAEAKKEQKEAEAIIKQNEQRLQIRKSALAKLAALGLTEDEIAAL